jgi:hypothetical protein
MDVDKPLETNDPNYFLDLWHMTNKDLVIHAIVTVQANFREPLWVPQGQLCTDVKTILIKVCGWSPNATEELEQFTKDLLNEDITWNQLPRLTTDMLRRFGLSLGAAISFVSAAKFAPLLVTFATTNRQILSNICFCDPKKVVIWDPARYEWSINEVE